MIGVLALFSATSGQSLSEESDLHREMSTTITKMNTSVAKTTMGQRWTPSPQAATSDPILRFLDEPFKTWPSTILFVAVLVVIGSVAIFLGVRYMETFRFYNRRCCKGPPTLEGQRGDIWEQSGSDETSSPDEGAQSSDIGFWDDQESHIRKRSGVGGGHIQIGTVAIGEVREGRIAQRRASSSRKV